MLALPAMRDKWDVLLVVVVVAGVTALLASVFLDASILDYGWVLTGLGGPALVLRPRPSPPPDVGGEPS